jgi:hypothetical protein
MRTKMIKLAEVIRMINTQIEQATDENVKESLCDLAATLLHANNVYHGFMYTFWTAEVLGKYESVGDAIAAGLGTEFDRYYFYTHI